MESPFKLNLSTCTFTCYYLFFQNSFHLAVKGLKGSPLFLSHFAADHAVSSA